MRGDRVKVTSRLLLRDLVMRETRITPKCIASAESVWREKKEFGLQL